MLYYVNHAMYSVLFICYYIMLYYILHYFILYYLMLDYQLPQLVAVDECPETGSSAALIRPVHLLRVSLLRVLESNFPGDSLYNYTDMIVPTP